MNLEELKDELKIVSNVADSIKNAHSNVAKKCGISNKYSQQIRNAEGAKTDNKENRALVKKMISCYRKELNTCVRKIEVYSTEVEAKN